MGRSNHRRGGGTASRRACRASSRAAATVVLATPCPLARTGCCALLVAPPTLQRRAPGPAERRLGGTTSHLPATGATRPPPDRQPAHQHAEEAPVSQTSSRIRTILPTSSRTALGATVATGLLTALASAPERISRLLRDRYPVVAVTGMTGVGKSQLVDRLARRSTDDAVAEVGSAVMERRTRRGVQAARLPLPRGARRQRRHAARRPRRGLPRRARRRRDPRRRGRPRHPAPRRRHDGSGHRHPRGAARRGARGLDDHVAPHRLDGRAPQQADLAHHRRDEDRPLPRRRRRGRALLLAGQRLALRRAGRRTAGPRRRREALHRRAPGVEPGRRPQVAAPREARRAPSSTPSPTAWAS